MKRKYQGLLRKTVMFALGVFLALPMIANAQGRGQGRGKPTEVFINGHDARDGRWDKNNGQRRRRARDRRDDWRRDDRRDDEWRNRDDDWRNRNDNWRYGDSFQLRQTALNAGYNEGIQEGRRDRDRGERFEYRDEGDYQNATRDYSSRLGDRELYRQYFRQGFANGYRDGYRGY